MPKLARQYALLLIALLLVMSGCRSPSIYPPDKTAAVNGTRLAYAEAGSDIPIVFVHGAFSDTRAWLAEEEPIAAQYRFVAYSMRYHSPNQWQDNGSMYNIQTHPAEGVQTKSWTTWR
jgi:uncharacterized protein YcfL